MPSEFDAIKETKVLADSQFSEAIEKIYRENLDEIDVQKIRKLRLINDELGQNNGEIKKFALWIFILTCVWGVCIFTVLFFQGFELSKFHLTESVLITLITSTTINFFGFFILVTRYLFNTESAKQGADK